MDLAEIIRLLASMPEKRVRLVAAGAGVPFHTILKIRNGQTENPRYATVARLARYFETDPVPCTHDETEAA